MFSRFYGPNHLHCGLCFGISISEKWWRWNQTWVMFIYVTFKQKSSTHANTTPNKSHQQATAIVASSFTLSVLFRAGIESSDPASWLLLRLSLNNKNRTPTWTRSVYKSLQPLSTPTARSAYLLKSTPFWTAILVGSSGEHLLGLIPFYHHYRVHRPPCLSCWVLRKMQQQLEWFLEFLV